MASGSGQRALHALSAAARHMELLASAPRKPGYQQWWNVPAKIARGEEIAQEELERAARLGAARGDRNNGIDAMRHARWSARMAQDTGPVFATAAGYAHEAQNLVDGWPLRETVMDLHNNAMGIAAARRGETIDPRTLQLAPTAPPLKPRRDYITSP